MRERWFFKTQRKVGEMRNTGRSEREATVISQMRFRQTALNTTSFIVGNHNTGKRDYCGEEKSIKHL